MIQRYGIKEKAIKLRTEGKSIRDIQKELNIAKSTLSGWFKNITLTENQKKILNEKAKIALVKARQNALKWHHQQKQLRIKRAKNEAENALNNIDTNNVYILELALALLYLGEGSKSETTSMGNSNPMILKFFIKSIKRVFTNAKLGKLELHLRSDQNADKEIKYWSKELNINTSNFSYIKDKRVAKSKTYAYYHGVCVVRFSEISIQRRLVFLSSKYCNIIANTDS